MLLYKADENGLVFHTSAIKDLYQQTLKNPNAELCFNCNGTQIRVSGQLEIISDKTLKDEIIEHPTRTFLKTWKESGEIVDFYENFVVFSLRNGIATTWTMADNFSKKSYINL